LRSGASRFNRGVQARMLVWKAMLLITLVISSIRFEFADGIHRFNHFAGDASPVWAFFTAS
jgi:hypothetical protein